MIMDYLNAGYPCLYMVHPDPSMAKYLAPLSETTKSWTWDCNEGLINIEESSARDDEMIDPVSMMSWLNKQTNTIVFAKNLHFFMDSPEVLQAIQNGQDYWKSRGAMLINVSPVLKLRTEVERYFQVIDVPFPDVPIMEKIQDYLLDQESVRDLGVKKNYDAAVAACGMTEFEAESAFAYSLIKTKKFDTDLINKIKAQVLRRTGVLDFWPKEAISSVGGLTQLKDWFYSRVEAYKPGNEHLPKVRAILLVGVPGTGKSLFAKAAASITSWPLIRLDVSALKNSLVGESEANTRNAVKIIDAFGRSICWVDEVEKALGSAKASAQTGDVTGSQMGILLTWMQESKGEWLMIATANDITQLQPEFLRRFDKIFFSDVPTTLEREEILTIQTKKWGVDCPHNARMVSDLEGYTGAEIEKVVKEMHFSVWDKALKSVVPIAKTMKEEIDALRSWAKNRAIIANTPEVIEENLKRNINL